MKNISQDDIRSLVIPLPDLHMQVALLREIENGMVRKTCFESAIKMQIEKLKAQGRIQRIGPDKGGRWQAAE